MCRNPFRRIVVRAVEIVYALDEALRLLGAYEPPDPPAVEVVPRAGVGFGWTEAPRGLLWDRYAIDDDGTILEARIVPPTSQNQGRIEQSLYGFVQQHAELAGRVRELAPAGVEVREVESDATALVDVWSGA